MHVVCKKPVSYKVLLDKIEALPNMEHECPQCKASPDVLYGWAPVLTIIPFPWIGDVLFVCKEACWACGYHKVRYVCVGSWSSKERLVFMLLFKIVDQREKRWLTAQEIVDARLYEGKGIA